jgi:hypothetical protein
VNSLFCALTDDAPAAEKVVGVVVGKGFPVDQAVKILSSAPQDVMFVWVEPKRNVTRDGVTTINEEVRVREQLPLAIHVILPLNPYWKHARGDFRRTMADCELSSYCSQVMVFDDSGDRCKWWRWQAQWMKKIKIIPFTPPGKPVSSGKARKVTSSS